MNENKKKCRKCLQKVNKDEIIKTREGYYCEVCHKKDELHGNIALGIAGFFIIALVVMFIWKYNEIKKEKESEN